MLGLNGECLPRGLRLVKKQKKNTLKLTAGVMEEQAESLGYINVR